MTLLHDSHFRTPTFAGFETCSSAPDKREDDVKFVAELLSSVAGELCAEETFETGLGGIVETVDHLAVDVPKAYSFVVHLLVGTRLPRTKVEGLANKIIFDGDPLTPPPKRLIAGYKSTCRFRAVRSLYHPRAPLDYNWAPALCSSNTIAFFPSPLLPVKPPVAPSLDLGVLCKVCLAPHMILAKPMEGRVAEQQIGGC